MVSQDYSTMLIRAMALTQVLLDKLFWYTCFLFCQSICNDYIDFHGYTDGKQRHSDNLDGSIFPLFNLNISIELSIERYSFYSVAV